LKLITELQELVQICKEILRWVKFSNIGKLKEGQKEIKVLTTEELIRKVRFIKKEQI